MRSGVGEQLGNRGGTLTNAGDGGTWTTLGGTTGDMSTSDQPPPIPRDLSTDEPDLPSDAELDAMVPPLPPLDTDPMAPMPPVAPGPEESRPPIEGAPQPTSSLGEIAEVADEGGLSAPDR